MTCTGLRLIFLQYNIACKNKAKKNTCGSISPTDPIFFCQRNPIFSGWLRLEHMACQNGAYCHNLLTNPLKPLKKGLKNFFPDLPTRFHDMKPEWDLIKDKPAKKAGGYPVTSFLICGDSRWIYKLQCLFSKVTFVIYWNIYQPVFSHMTMSSSYPVTSFIKISVCNYYRSSGSLKLLENVL